MRNEVGALTPVEVMVFRELKLAGVILLTEKPVIIVGRVNRRDGVAITFGEIYEFANAELVHANKVCLELALPLEVINSPTEMSVAKTVKRML